MHAQYCEDEQIDSQYSVHRICQAYQLSRLINLVVGSLASDSRKYHDIILFGGDLNTGSNDLPYRIITSITGMVDSCQKYQKHVACNLNGHKENMNQAYFIEDKDYHTWLHPNNTFSETPTKDPTKDRNGAYENSEKYGKRIDFIMYKYLQHGEKEKRDSLTSIENIILDDFLHCSGKCPQTGLSFSDHQPVSILLKVNVRNSLESINSAIDCIEREYPPTRLRNIDRRRFDTRNTFQSLLLSANVPTASPCRRKLLFQYHDGT